MITMKGDIRERCEILAEYMIRERATIRRAAYRFGISKSTVHKDLAEKLPHINMQLFCEVRELLELNKAERHLRGGEATKKKYEICREAAEACGRTAAKQ